MASPNSVELSVDREEYSPYESARSVITVTVTSNGGAPYTTADTVTVELRKARRDREEVVTSQILELEASSDPDVQVVTFDLSTLKDPSDALLLRRGKYFVRAYTTADPDTYGDSPDFHVSVVSVEQLKQTYLYGLPLGATLSRHVRYQPTNVSGVVIQTLSEEHPTGFFTLAYNVSEAGVRTLSWGGGTSVVVNAPGKYLLKAGSLISTNSPLGKLSVAQQQNPDFVEVLVQSVSALPSESTSDELLVEKKTLDSDSLRNFITQACDWLEKVALGTFIEPTRVSTEPNSTEHDFLVNALTYFSQQKSQWMQIQTPYMNILRVNALYGDIATVRVLNVDLNWVEHSGPGGYIQLIPFNSTVAFTAAGLLWMGTLSSPTEIPNFWHFDMLVGLKECPPNLREIVAKKAAIEALVLLGQALRPGVGSFSLGRDGVSQSISYTNQAQYGAYTGTISLYKEWIENELKNYCGVYRGPAMVVV